VNGTLKNEGVISGDTDGGTLLIEELEELDDINIAGLDEYQAKNGGTLEFASTISTIGGGSLDGDFAVGTNANFATLRVNRAITSTGRLDMGAGLVDVNQNFTLGSANRFLHMTAGTVEVEPNKRFLHE
jgi:hypothetical protein